MTIASQNDQRILPIGAEVAAGGGTHFRVWAPRRTHVAVVLEEKNAVTELAAEDNGYFSALVHKAQAGMRYRFRLDGERALYPDPASRFQPDGPHGPSEIVDPAQFQWSDEAWSGIDPAACVLYELHIGAFTSAGTWEAAASKLPALADLGVTVLEVMPVADFPGRFGWGYDGVNLFAPTRLYGRPNDFRRFVDRAHQLQLAVILDVVYNHLGPDGNYLPQFSDTWFTDRYPGEWGDPLNLDGPGNAGVREFLRANVHYWISEFHLDGFRFDATQGIYDASGTHILAELTQTARAGAGRKSIYLSAENEPQDVTHVQPISHGGYGMDALWNDDWHHSAIVALTGKNEAYYSDHLGAPQEFISAAKFGFLFQGQHYTWQNKRRGTRATDLPFSAFIQYLQNHDQVANSARGERIHQLTSPGRLRALTALLLLAPATPLLFMGQEFGASAPFLYFADHNPDLARQVARGRHQFLRQFPSIVSADEAEPLADPADPDTFSGCKLDWTEHERNAQLRDLHRDLLELRRTDMTLAQRQTLDIDGAVLSSAAFLLRFFGSDGTGMADRLLLVNPGRDLELAPAPEPLLAPPSGCRWQLCWSSEDVRYGGRAHAPPEDDDGRWRVPAECAVVMVPSPLRV